MKPADRLLADPAFHDLKAMVIALTGLAYWGDKEPALATALAPLLAERGIGAAAFASSIAAEGGRGPATDALIRAVTVGETYFFRYSDQFTAFERDILPECLHRNRDRRSLSVWSAGCSNGAETYSLAMAVRRSGMLEGWRVQILGTDVSRHALASAAAGEYGDWAVRGMSAPLLTECFSRAGNKWRVRDVYREGVEFRCHNLVTEPPPPGLAPGGTFDVVFCRNVLMYFDGATRDTVLASLHAGLAEGGWLAVAHAEAGPQITKYFKTVGVGATVLYRNLPQPPDPARVPASPPRRRPARPVTTPQAAAPPYKDEIVGLLDQGAFSQAAERARQWIEAEPMEPAAQYYLGLALEASSPAQAMGAFRRAVYLAPGFSLALFHLSRLSQGSESQRYRQAAEASLSGPEDRELELGDGLTAGDLAAIIRQSDPENVR